MMEEIDKNDAIKIASEYGLEGEVKYSMNVLGMSPVEALIEWDLL